MDTCQHLNSTDGAPPFRLRSLRLGLLPLINHVIDQLELTHLLESFVPTTDGRCRLRYSHALGVLVRSLLIDREPLYRHDELLRLYGPQALGLSEPESHRLGDDALGRALDQLFLADRSALLTQIVVRMTRHYGIALDELHNDSTSISFFGQYRCAKGRSIRGKQALKITHGFSKDHRPDLKQLLWILTTSADGGVPVQFRCADGNKADAVTHVETWNTLRQLTGRPDFLYVADSKLCTHENMQHLTQQGGRFVTVMPRNRKEDKWFRDWIQDHSVPWETAWDRPNPRRKYGPRDRWFVHRPVERSLEGWPVTWVYSTLLALAHKLSRQDRLHQAQEELEALDQKLRGPRPRRRAQARIAGAAHEILKRLHVEEYVAVTVWTEEQPLYRQDQRGRPGPATRYKRDIKRRLRLRWTLNQERIAYDEKSDGMYPLLCNDPTLSSLQILEAHKRQPQLEKRFEQLKTVHEITPVFLKKEDRIEAFFSLYFIALMIQALVEREIRRGMDNAGVESLPLYPEERSCSHPTFAQLLRLFEVSEWHQIWQTGDLVQDFPPALSDMQSRVLELMKIPQATYLTQK